MLRSAASGQGLHADRAASIESSDRDSIATLASAGRLLGPTGRGEIRVSCAGVIARPYPIDHRRKTLMSIVQEFKEFAIKGNMVDLAVAVIIGGAFGKIIDSLVKDVIMPVIGLFLGGIDFRSLFFTLGSGTYATLAEAEKAGAAVFRYGAFLQTVVDFLIIAWVVFIAIKAINRMKREQPPAPPEAPAEEVLLLREIRDAVRKA
jgi:large conductance mechanosensitive channel